MYRKIFIRNKQAIRIFPLGGMGNVTKNLFVYEYLLDGQIIDILLVDCGIGFPDESAYGVDLVIPDITYLKDKQEKIRGMILTHGHDDHLGSLSFILPQLSRFPIYGTRLTVALAQMKLNEYGIKANFGIFGLGHHGGISSSRGDKSLAAPDISLK